MVIVLRLLNNISYGLQQSGGHSVLRGSGVVTVSKLTAAVIEKKAEKLS